MKLTYPLIKSLKPTDKPQKFVDGKGLNLLVTPSGSKLWRYRHRFNGKETIEGRMYFNQCLQALQALQQISEAERILTGTKATPSGTLRISVPTTYGHFRLLPILPKFMEKHPDINIDIHISNRNVDFIDEEYDLAIRLGTPPDSRLIARKLEDVSLGVFASPEYLLKNGTPTTIDALEHHQCIQFIQPSTGRLMLWACRENGKDVDLSPNGRIKVLEDVLGCVNFAIAGGGLYQTYHFIVKDNVFRGELREVLQNNNGRARQFSLLYPQNRHQSVKTQCFVDFLLAHIKSLG